MTNRRRKNFTKRTIAERYLFAGGHCETCGVAVKAGQYHADHLTPDGLTGEPTFENCRIVCEPCHAEKTKQDVANIAEAVRREAIHTGADRVAKRQSGAPKIQSRGFAKKSRDSSKLDQLRALRERQFI